MWHKLIKEDSSVWYEEGFKTDDFLQCFIKAFLISNLCTLIHDQNEKLVFILNLPDLWSLDETNPVDETRLFGSAITNQFVKLRQLCSDTNSDQTEYFHSSGRTFEFNCSTIDIAGKKHIVTVITDRTDEVRREKTLQTLLREVSHRSKNMLAIVQSIASQTAKHASTIDSFLKKFTGRVYSLSVSQDLITVSSWSGANFYQLALEQTERYVTDSDTAITLTGDDVELSPNEALHIGLALHELIVNSLSYGALSQGCGEIAITSSTTQVEDQTEITIEWKETQLSETLKNDTIHHRFVKKFGINLLEKLLPLAVNGKAEYDVGADSVNYKLSFMKKSG